MRISILVLIILMALASKSNAGQLDLLYDSSSAGGVNGYTAGLDLEDSIDDKITISAYYRRSESEDVVSEDKGALSVEYDPAINDRWSLWLDVKAGHDKVLGIKRESSTGFGVKYYILKSESRKLSLSGGILYDHISNDCSEVDDCSEGGNGRYSFRIKFKNDTFKAVALYQPDMENHSDYNGQIECDAEVAKIGRLNLLVYAKWKHKSDYGISRNKGIKIRLNY